MNRPPEPRLSALVQTFRFATSPLELVDQARAECGDIFALRLLGLGRWVFLCSPDAVEQLAKAPADVLAAGEINRDSFAALTGVDSSFALDGETHRRRRKLLQPLFSEARATEQVETIRKITSMTLERWPTHTPFPLLPETHHISLQVILHSVFGLDGEGASQRISSLLRQLATEGFSSPLLMVPPLQLDLGPWSPWGRIKRLHARVLELLTEEIERRRVSADGEERKDVLGTMLGARDEDGAPMPTTSIRDELLQLLFAGHETTGTILAWAIERILVHSDVLERVRGELAAVLAGGPIAERHLGRLPFLDAVIKESIRSRPLAPMSGVRRVRKAFSVGGYLVPEGDVVVIGFRGLSRNDAVFPESDRFSPDRFLIRKPTPFEWSPFGGGTRQCVGRKLAELELKVVIATLLSRTKMHLARTPVKAVRRGLLLAPEAGLRVVLEATMPPPTEEDRGDCSPASGG